MLFSAKNPALCPDELRCDSNQLGLIIDHIKSHPHVRININLIEKDAGEKLQEELSILTKITTNYTIACSKFSDLKSLLQEDIPAYFNFPVTDWETFSALIDWGVSDILIDGPLGFQMDSIKSKKGKTLIRVRPNESPNAAICVRSNENTFFIRPEDLHIYSPFVDVCEIRSKDKEKEKVLFDVYKRGTFVNDISILIPQIKMSVKNPFIHKNFAGSRLNCGQKCKSGKGRCNRCKMLLHLTNLVTETFEQTKDQN